MFSIANREDTRIVLVCMRVCVCAYFIPIASKENDLKKT